MEKAEKDEGPVPSIYEDNEPVEEVEEDAGACPASMYLELNQVQSCFLVTRKANLDYNS